MRKGQSIDYLKEWKRHYEKMSSQSGSQIEKNQLIWREIPVNFETFCADFIKEPLFPGPQTEFARDVIGVNGTEWTETYTNALLFYGKGAGKTAISAKLVAYTAYRLLCMYDPRAFFGLGKTAPIDIINISYNARQAKGVFFQGYLIPTVLNCRNPLTGRNWFAEKGMNLKVGDTHILSDTIFFEKPQSEELAEGGIKAVSLAGDKGTAEGYSPILVFVDEFAAFQLPDKAVKLLDDLEKSAKSRFNNRYKMIVCSFKRAKNCLMSLRIKDAEDGKLLRPYISRAATWEVNPTRKQIDYEEMYKTNPVTSARTFECKEVGGVDDTLFFKQPDVLLRIFDETWENPIEHDMTTVKSDDLRLLRFKDFFKANSFAKYFIHVDLAKGTGSDRAGITMVHKQGVDSLSDDELSKWITGELQGKEFKVYADLILQICASTRGEIILEEIRQFIIRLHSMGFRVSVTLDGYESLDFIQQLNNRGIPSKLLSVDKNRKAYDSLQTLIYRGNLVCYPHQVLHRELSELEESENGKKIDHPIKSIVRAKYEDGIDLGSKDLSDALCGACLECVLAPGFRVPMKAIAGKASHPKDEIAADLERFDNSIYGKLRRPEQVTDRPEGGKTKSWMFPVKG